MAASSSHPLPIIDPSQETSSFFDLSRGALLQATLFRLADNDHLLLLRTHLIISDGWSMDILFRELTMLYDAFSKALPSPLSELPIQYADFALWQRQQLQGEVLSHLVSYWQEQLSGPLPLRTDLSGNPSFREFLSRSQEVVQGAFAHQELPFDKLIEEVNPARELKQQRLFQVEFTFQERPISVMEQSGLKWIVLPVEKQSEEYDLSLKIIDDGKQLLTTGMPARLTFEYSPDLFNQSTISRMMGHFERLLEGIVANPEHSC
jgi:hypothetical protein